MRSASQFCVFGRKPNGIYVSLREVLDEWSISTLRQYLASVFTHQNQQAISTTQCMSAFNVGDQTLMKKTFKHTVVHGAIVFLGFSTLYTLFFSPVLFSNKLLAPGDGLVYFLPAFYGPIHFWTELIFAGYPLIADPQNMSWYPPALILRLIPHSWNIFIVLAYVLSSSFSYCYVYTITSSRLGAMISGLIYGLNGFMVYYLSVAAMIHAAVWMPLIICAFEKIRYEDNKTWFAISILSITLCILAGNPQISVYVLGLSFLYAAFLGWKSPIGRWKYYRRIILIFSIGLSLSAFQILPTIELGGLSVRSEISYEVFLEGSLHLLQGLSFFIFPFLHWEGIHFPVYVGLLPLLLAFIGFASYRDRLIAIFWFLVAVIAFLLAFGDTFLLGKVLYRIPFYNLFRVQSRHTLELAFAVSVLAGFGVSSIQRGWVYKRLIYKVITSGFLVITAIILHLIISKDYFISQAALIGISNLSLFPWNNPNIGIPLIVFFSGVITLLVWFRWKNSCFTAVLLATILTLDLLSLAGFYWNWNSSLIAPSEAKILNKSFVTPYISNLQEKHQRFLPSEGIWASGHPDSSIYPNLTRLWNLPSAGGYSPLILSRFSEMMRMDFAGFLNPSAFKQIERQLDLMAVQYILTQPPKVIEREGVFWTDSDPLNIVLGQGACSSSNGSRSVETIDLSNIPKETTSIGIVTTLGCATNIPDNSTVLELKVVDTENKVETHELKAGVNTAETAYDCLDVKPNVQHKRPSIFSSELMVRPDGSSCQAHDYVSFIQLNRPQENKRIELKLKDFPVVVNIKHISLINDLENTSQPLGTIALSSKWRQIEQIEDGIIYENQDVLPRTWLVPETIVLKSEEVLTAIHSSQLPDGRTYDPKTMALVEDAAGRFQASSLKPTDSAKVLKLEETQVELQTQTADPAFLVLSDVFYPGWKATIDGKPTRIFQTNYIQRGIKVPGGNHIVRFEFHPLSFKLGLGITMASFFGGAYWLARKRLDNV